MSVYISGVEMPKEHPLYITLRPDGSVHVWDSYIGTGHGTQAIFVPEHGELIERDTLSKRIKEETINQAEFYADRRHPVVLAYGDCYGKVQNAPTIIPADKEEQT